MKLIKIVSIIAFVFAGFFGYSQETNPNKGKFTENISKIVTNLTPEQKEKLDAVAADFFRTVRPQKDAIKDLKEKVKALEAKGNYDVKEMNALVDKIAAQQAELDKQMLAFRKKIATILTKEQLEELKKAKSKYSN